LLLELGEFQAERSDPSHLSLLQAGFEDVKEFIVENAIRRGRCGQILGIRMQARHSRIGSSKSDTYINKEDIELAKSVSATDR